MLDLKFAIRRILKSKVYSLIILLSLVIGLACSNLLISFLIAETNTDSFHSKKERIFQLFSDDPFGGKKRIAFIMNVIPGYLTDNYQEAERVSQLLKIDEVSLTTDTGKFHDVGILSTDSSFFSLFDFPIYEGAGVNGLTPESIILTRERAKIIFGEDRVVGRTLKFETPDTARLLTVAAVIDHLPENSHLIFDGLIHHSVLKTGFSGGTCYVLLQEGIQSIEFEKKINGDSEIPNLLGKGNGGYHLELLSESYFSADNTMPFTKTRNKVLIWIGYVVCALVLFMASFNFVNLFLLSLQERKKDTGIRKTLGVSLGNLIKACSIEAMIYLGIGFASSLFLTYMLLPGFNSILQADLKFSYLSNVEVFSAISLIFILLGGLVVAVSVLRQWRIKPISLMKNDLTSKLTFNRFLFTIQFVISITLVICSVTIIHQMNFLEKAPLGFNKNIIQLNSFSAASAKSLPVLKQNILQIPAIDHATICSGNPISGNMIVRYELEDGEIFTPYLFTGDNDFLSTLKLTLVEGEFSTGDGKLVNEKLVSYFNMKHPIGEIIPGTKDRIAGVVKDFTCVSFKQSIPPVIISNSAENRHILLDFNGAEMGKLLPAIQSTWKKVFPEQPFTFQILAQDLAGKYKEDTFFYRIVIAFSMVSMALSCFGLFALSWGVTQSKTKEIGIRKVLGATAKDILDLLTRTFAWRIVIAFLIAAPTGYLLMDKWLSNFVSKVSINGWIFVFSGAIVILVAFLTLFLQTFKAAMANPVDELRAE